MKAAIFTRYGAPENLRIAELPVPAPGPGEVLVRIHASTAGTGDHRVRSGDVPWEFQLPMRLAFGLFRPRTRTLGSDLAGEIAAVGAGVTRWTPGEPVFGYHLMGTNAEYLVLSEDGVLAPMPAGLSWAEAATAPVSGLTALEFLRDIGGLKPGERVLVNGASGAVGAYAVQIARALGAEVTGVTSGANRTLVRSLGAARVIDYRSEDLTKERERFDLILDTVGNLSLARHGHLLAPSGRLVMTNARGSDWIRMLRTRKATGRRVLTGVQEAKAADLRTLGAMLASGRVEAVIDRTLPLSDISAAHAHVATGRKVGVVVLDVSGQAQAVPVPAKQVG